VKTEVAVKSISIAKIRSGDEEWLGPLARETFLISHADAAAEDEIQAYLARAFAPPVIAEELGDGRNLFYALNVDARTAGYSKIIPDCTHAGSWIAGAAEIKEIQGPNVTKVERLYFAKEFHGMGLARRLFEFNLGLARERGQRGIWLTVWTENFQAIDFYKKVGFKIVGEIDFKISESRANPNHVMYLEL
jgi:diamine N-acetyltransferase